MFSGEPLTARTVTATVIIVSAVVLIVGEEHKAPAE
jgi:hypothetical protein